MKTTKTTSIKAQLAELSQGQSTIERELAEVAELLRGRELSARGTILPEVPDLRDQVRAIVAEYLAAPDAAEPPVGDDATPAELLAQVRRLLEGGQLTFQELLTATGARPNRVSGCIVTLRREGARIRNVGSPKRAVWTILPPTRRAGRGGAGRA
jgi:hypothetical protein